MKRFSEKTTLSDWRFVCVRIGAFGHTRLGDLTLVVQNYHFVLTHGYFPSVSV